MNLTNKNNFPEALVKALENDSYSKGNSDYSITELLQPPRVVALRKTFKEQLSDDVEDRLWSLYGQIAHVILERAGQVNDVTEKRYFAKFKSPSGEVVVSAQVDTLSIVRKILSDWKFTSSWGFKKGEPPKAEWVAQLNGQLEILRRNGLDAERLRIVGLLRDWSKLEAKRTPDYPQKGVVSVEIPVWSREETTSFIEMRVALMEQAKAATSQDELPLCTPDERYAKPDIWAVMKGLKAVPFGLCSTESLAKKKLEEVPTGRIEFRPGVSVKCESYCNVSEYCEQYKKTKGE